VEDAAQLRKRADQAFRLGSAMTSLDDRARIMTYAEELYAAAEAAEETAFDTREPPAD
jgi:hypothetical protein